MATERRGSPVRDEDCPGRWLSGPVLHVWTRQRRLLTAAGVAALAYVMLREASWALGTSTSNWLDFHSFLVSGAAMARGMNPYTAYPSVFAPRMGGTYYPSPNLNPPITVYIFEFATRLNLPAAHLVWQLATLLFAGLSICLLALAYPVARSTWRIASVLSLTGVWHTIQLGQIYAPLLLAATGAWILLDRRRPALAGLLIGSLVAVKPTYVLWPVLLLAAGHRRAGAAALTTAAAISTVPLAIRGPGIYREWIAASLQYGGTVMPGNTSLLATASRFKVSGVGALLTVALIAGLVYAIRRMQPRAIVVSEAALAGSLLVGPISWVGYTILLFPIFLARSRWSALTVAPVFMLAVPFPVVLQLATSSPHGFALAGSVYVVPALLVLAIVCRDLGMPPMGWRRDRAPGPPLRSPHDSSCGDGPLGTGPSSLDGRASRRVRLG